MHSLILGMTSSGKTFLSRIICAKLTAKRKRCVVLDPLMDRGWKAELVSRNPDEFLKFCKSNTNLYIFIDEGGESVGRYNVEMQWFATQARHWGHSCFFISQGATQLPRIVRDQCEQVFLFTVGRRELELLGDEFCVDDLKRSERLQKGNFYLISRFKPLQRGRVDFNKRSVYYEDATIAQKDISNEPTQTPAPGNPVPTPPGDDGLRNSASSVSKSKP